MWIMYRKIIVLLVIMAMPLFCIFAQNISDDLTSEIPVGAEIKIGKLDNGLTYYIRKNTKPENRLELRLAVNAGSMQEDDDQLGLAHFTEHMAFNGTENFEKNEIVNYLQSIGVKFGADLNAYTSFDETVYMIQSIPTDNEEFIEKGFQILADWAHAVTFEDQEIDKERGVVIEEWRRGRGASQRMRDEWFPIVFENSRYADRIPIGTKDILENFDYETIKRFYNEWYRPELMAVVAVGDLEIDKMEALVKDKFGDIPSAQNPRERVLYPVPDHPDVKIAVVTDEEASQNQVNLYYKQDNEIEETLADYRKFLTYRLFTGMLNLRLRELTQQADPPFIFGSAYYGDFVRSKDFYGLSAAVGENGIERGLKTLLEENEKVKRYGFTQTELDRFKNQLLVQYEKAYNEREKTESRMYADEYVRNFLEEEPIPGIAFEYRFAEKYLPEVTLEEVNQLADEFITDENRVVLITAPEKEGVSVPSEEEVSSILDEAENMQVEAYVDQAVAGSLMEELPQPGKVTEEKKLVAIGVTQLSLANGVKVILKPTDFKADEILMSAFSPGGNSLYPIEAYPSSVFADDIITQSGVKDFSSIELQKFLSDKNAGVSPYIRELQEGFQGNATPKDLETMLQLTHLYFTAPRKDEAAFQGYMSRVKASIANVMADPTRYYYDQLSRIMSQNHPRGGIYPTNEELNSVQFDDTYRIYKERFSNAGDFTFLFVGNFEVETIKPLLETYLGSLPSTDTEESWKDVGIRPPEGLVQKTIEKGADPKSMVTINFTSPFEYTKDEAFKLDALIQALQIKLIEEIREESSGVYSIGAYADAEQFPYENYTITVRFPCAPENADKLTEGVFAEIKKMMDNGPTEVDLNKVKEAKYRDMETSLKENRFWLSTLQRYYWYDQDPVKILNYKESIDGLSIEQLKETANKYFDMNNYVKVVLMPEKTAESGK